jgi:hypothetical protein
MKDGSVLRSLRTSIRIISCENIVLESKSVHFVIRTKLFGQIQQTQLLRLDKVVTVDEDLKFSSIFDTDEIKATHFLSGKLIS